MSLYRGKVKQRQMLEVGKQQWLPLQVQVSLHDLMGAAKEGLLALAVAVGLDVLRSMMEAEVTAIVGPKGKHNPNRKAFRHGTEEGRVVLGGRKVPIQRPRCQWPFENRQMWPRKSRSWTGNSQPPSALLEGGMEVDFFLGVRPVRRACAP